MLSSSFPASIELGEDERKYFLAELEILNSVVNQCAVSEEGWAPLPCAVTAVFSSIGSHAQAGEGDKP